MACSTWKRTIYNHFKSIWEVPELRPLAGFKSKQPRLQRSHRFIYQKCTRMEYAGELHRSFKFKSCSDTKGLWKQHLIPFLTDYTNSYITVLKSAMNVYTGRYPSTILTSTYIAASHRVKRNSCRLDQTVQKSHQASLCWGLLNHKTLQHNRGRVVF